jgi:hypothetical protein
MEAYWVATLLRIANRLKTTFDEKQHEIFEHKVARGRGGHNP